MSLAAILSRAEDLYHDIDLRSVTEWRSTHGGKVIGFLPIYVPREIIHAAGMLPVGILGGSGQVEIIRGDAYFQSYICQMPRSTIELALSGRLDAVDGFLFPSTCDVIRNLSGMWKILFPEKWVRYFDVPQNFDPEVGGRFYSHELQTIRSELERIGGSAITNDAITASIAAYNENRRRVRALAALRARSPWQAPASEVYLVMRAGNLLPVEEHTALLDAYLGEVTSVDRPRRDHLRVVTVGSFCEQPPLDLIKTLERAGCYIVWDDMLLGQHWLEADVETGGDPIAALALAFLRHSTRTAARYEPERGRGEHVVQLARRTRAEGVVFAAPSFCDPALLEQPMLQDALDRAAVPWTAFKYAENLGQFQVIREQAGTFADSVKLWSEA
jgi:benzoyl-CoA reductase subunit C